ncbi:SufE family protein [Chlamydia gallinacea]|uniref:Fe-S metabolism protein SufE n=2 Tax=Chlamydia gallinacea TaxID=1457153 RepID=A0A173DXY8_9CHLA|nr:SufE family protein [Chlamydia gallinacea]ANG65786.1 Fe-S metabolism protein SufE [Chlamydia gallinacea 08-1274/3]AQT77153.1 hypothetical protein B1F83_00475 [Chlamydia gallinacea]MBX6680343.1 SufE family protein [Chlamydia gallinacea]MBX6687535.1 SufE family protein [Chlamydia gallinacea]
MELVHSHTSCLEKQNRISQFLLAEPLHPDTLYASILKIGARPREFDTSKISKKNLVLGCQSDLYLYETYQKGRLFFFTHTEALISSGIAAIFTEIYSGELPETVLTCKPVFFDKLSQYLSLGRRAGGEALYMRMKQISIRYLKSPTPSF